MNWKHALGITGLVLLAIPLVVATIALLQSAGNQPRALCGNQLLEEGESPQNCCDDTGCLPSQICTNHSCIAISCGYCEYAANETCHRYECCSDSECGKNETCSSNTNKCAQIECECGYIKNRTCVEYECCTGFECPSGLCSNNKCVVEEQKKAAEAKDEATVANEESSKVRRSSGSESSSQEQQGSQQQQQQAQQQPSQPSQTCTPTPEVCDGVDNDCDGFVDESCVYDLDVTYIERTPKYPKYRVTYFGDRNMCNPEYQSYYPYQEDRGPQLCPGELGKKRWPDAGETVTFTAHIKNNGNDPISAFSYKWFIDGAEIKSGAHNSLAVGEEGTETLQWVWPATLINHKVKFIADSSNLITEKFETNNRIDDYTNALSFGMFISPSAYAALKTTSGTSSPSSPEDWVQKHVRRMNELFSLAGVKESIRLDKLFVESTIESDPDKWNMDGWWGIGSDYRETSAYYDSGEDVDYGMLHEMIHQLGVIDLYIMNSDTQYDKLLDKKYNTIGAGCGVSYGWPNVWDCYSLAVAQPAIGNDLANNVAHQIGLHTANMLNKNLHKRRGYFGEYLFNTPNTIKVRFLKSDGQPLDSATIRIYQPGLDRIIDSTKLNQILTTDTNGMITLGPVTGVWTTTGATETGHQLKANPYGLIDVVGRNGLFLFEIEKGSFDYKWLPLVLANIEYWKGNTQEAMFTITTNLN